jgi:hypothetical protein
MAHDNPALDSTKPLGNGPYRAPDNRFGDPPANTVGDRIMRCVSVRPGHNSWPAMRRDRSCLRPRLPSAINRF